MKIPGLQDLLDMHSEYLLAGRLLTPAGCCLLWHLLMRHVVIACRIRCLYETSVRRKGSLICITIYYELLVSRYDTC